MPTEHTACLMHCCRNTCGPMNLVSFLDLTKVTRDLAQILDTDTASISRQVSSILRQGLEKAKMAWSSRAKFYCATGNTNLNCTDCRVITQYTRKICVEVSTLFRIFGEKNYSLYILVFPYIEFDFS